MYVSVCYHIYVYVCSYVYVYIAGVYVCMYMCVCALAYICMFVSPHCCYINYVVACQMHKDTGISYLIATRYQIMQSHVITRLCDSVVVINL